MKDKISMPLIEAMLQYKRSLPWFSMDFLTSSCRARRTLPFLGVDPASRTDADTRLTGEP